MYNIRLFFMIEMFKKVAAWSTAQLLKLSNQIKHCCESGDPNLKIKPALFMFAFYSEHRRKMGQAEHCYENDKSLLSF